MKNQQQQPNPPQSTLSTEELIALDKQHVWHPYAPIGSECLPVASTNGVYIQLQHNDTTNTMLVDGMSSWWAAIHGYNHPHIIQRVQEQLQRMPHVMFGGLTHTPAVMLAAKLAQMTEQHQKVFFCDSGSVSIEVACKMAIQYHHSTHPKKQKFLTVRNGYHGDTWQCMSVCDPINGMHELFRNNLRIQYFAPPPSPEFHTAEFDAAPHMAEFERLLRTHAHEIAGVILEPIVQGAGGMRFYHAEYLRHVRRLCTQHDVLLIYDEIATGFGRTGKLFAKDHANHAEPDILCLGKALTGGTLSLAATLTTDKVAEQIANGPAGVLMHGPTFMGNPLACSAAVASLELMETGYWKTAVPKIEAQLRNELESCRESPYVKDVRVLGAIGVVELKEPIRDMKAMVPEIVRQGVWLRPFGRLLYTMPPFIIQPEQLSKITRAMVHLSRKLF